MKYSSRTFALLAGGSLLIMTIIAGFGYGYAFRHLYEAADALATVANLNAAPGLFRWLVFSFVAILVLDIVVAWALYFFFRRSNPALSLLSAWLRLVYSALLGIAVSGLSDILSLIPVARDEAGAVMNGFVFFLNTWSIGLIVFGCHLFILGTVALGSHSVPRTVGILVLVASACYILENAVHLLIPDYSCYADAVNKLLALPMALGELGLAVWLLIKGGKLPLTRSVPRNPIPDPAQ